VAKQRALADAGSMRDLIHRHGGGALRGDERFGRLEDRRAVACGVRPLVPGRFEHRQRPRHSVPTHALQPT